MPATRYLHGRDKRAVTQCDSTRCTEIVTVLTKNGIDTLRETLYVSPGRRVYTHSRASLCGPQWEGSVSTCTSGYRTEGLRLGPGMYIQLE